jgi:hypothetical protein
MQATKALFSILNGLIVGCLMTQYQMQILCSVEECKRNAFGVLKIIGNDIVT